MEHWITFSLTVFTGFFAIMNPIANMPIFLGLVQGRSKKTKRRISKKSTLTAFLIVFIFVILGKFIFELFGITIPAFKITGGILIFYVGFEMLQSKRPSVKNMQNSDDDEDDGDDDIAISPLAIPILAGPGTIVTAMNFVTDGNYIHIAIVIVMFALMCYLTYLSFNLSDFLVKKVGQNIITVIGKIMGLIIAIIGASMIIQGLKLAFNI